MSVWRPIETAPKTGELVLVWNGEGVRPAAWSETDGCWSDEVEHNGYDCVPIRATHWMPLPDPPRDSDTQPKAGDAQQGSACE